MTDTLERPPTRTRRRLLVAAAVIGIPALAIGWWLISPLFLNSTVDEAFPAPTSQAAVTQEAAVTTAVPAEASQPDPAVEAGENPDAGAAAAVAPEQDATADGTEAGEPPADSPAPAEPTAIATGEFAGADDFHQGSGTATVYQLEDGSHVLRFEDLDVTNGPDLHVLISNAGAITSREDLESAGYTDLGKLKGNRGNQNYELPADLDLAGPLTITIYCDPFHVVFATATLTA